MSKILVLGGLSFRGRTLSLHIIKNNLASKLLIVDKLVPQAAFLTKEMTELFEPHLLQADIARPESSQKVFEKENWEYVYNMIADIPCNQDNSVYRHGILNQSVVPASIAMKKGYLKCWVQISSYEVYKSSHEPKTEDSPIKPCSNRGKWFAKTEAELQKIKGLPLVILRTASTWGPYCVTESLIWAVMGDVYKYLGEPIPMIGRPDTRQNGVHVNDVVKAFIYLSMNWYRPGIMGKKTPIFNLSDKHDMSKSWFL
ncbi:putative dTDP-glucose 4,6-dehydratase [Neolecta irregularis DAH-3]|uniref:Putative dTDP-glucose 4,6-dehydratase n=1 Tax=Neolecta irregularis (strain DAH-3) TaxID=1198029 RepID=A0A1U7LSQ0_NEOID|nr:putative dTDP-glucose 4,6-dehydratase [Neolecta irregularis DAH-3]|eukprot:OLL25674.1 putative dTDP-glucose 4,6-dehydratase [Neolecta irregularis DAH-3]